MWTTPTTRHYTQLSTHTGRTREGATLRTLQDRLIEKKEVESLNHLVTEVVSGSVDVRNRVDSTSPSLQIGKLFAVNSIMETWIGS
jgi:hypothetical protein